MLEFDRDIFLRFLEKDRGILKTPSSLICGGRDGVAQDRRVILYRPLRCRISR